MDDIKKAEEAGIKDGRAFLSTQKPIKKWYTKVNIPLILAYVGVGVVILLLICFCIYKVVDSWALNENSNQNFYKLASSGDNLRAIAIFSVGLAFSGFSLMNSQSESKHLLWRYFKKDAKKSKRLSRKVVAISSYIMLIISIITLGTSISPKPEIIMNTAIGILLSDTIFCCILAFFAIMPILSED